MKAQHIIARLVFGLLITFTGCATPPSEEDTSSASSLSEADTSTTPEVTDKRTLLEGRLWRLDTIIQENGIKHTIPQDAVTAYFEEKTVGGRTACNYYGGPYDVDGSQLHIRGDEMPITAAGCEGVQGEQEELYIKGLRSAQTYAVNGEQLTIMFAGGTLVFTAQTDVAGNENAVYAALLRQWSNNFRQLVLLNTTRPNAAKPVDETISAVQQQLESFGGGVPLDEATIVDFREKNRSPQQLDHIFDVDIPTVYVTEQEINQLFTQGEQAGWQAFKERYPDAIGIISFSRVGFNIAGDQALVYMGLQGDDTGDFYSILMKNNGIWVTAVSFRLEE